MEPRSLLSHSQQPFTRPYLESDHPFPIPFLKDPFFTNIRYALLLAPYVLHALPDSFFLILLREYLVTSVGHEFLCCVAFLIILF